MSARKVAPSRGGIPREITVYRTPDGWRHKILTGGGGVLCGRLGNLAADATEGEAKSAASTMPEGLALDFHGVRVEIAWDSADTPATWNGVVSRCEP